MTNGNWQIRRSWAAGVFGAAFALHAATALAQTASQGGRDEGVYIPSIWVDPDGCEHWVMDDGAEGFMTPHVDREGIPVCRARDICAVMNSDQYFASDSFRIGGSGRARLTEFFGGSSASAFVITGHTDSIASDDYNMRLSIRRANAVADLARAQGSAISEVRGFGERQPIASNATAEGRASNRRVEITCIE